MPRVHLPNADELRCISDGKPELVTWGKKLRWQRIS